MARPMSEATKMTAYYKAALTKLKSNEEIQEYPGLTKFLLEFAILTVWRGQTPDEKEVKAALENNNKGFRKSDAGFGSYLAEYITRNMNNGRRLGTIITDGYVHKALSLIYKYWRQYGPYFLVAFNKYKTLNGYVTSPSASSDEAVVNIPLLPSYDDGECDDEPVPETQAVQQKPVVQVVTRLLPPISWLKDQLRGDEREVITRAMTLVSEGVPVELMSKLLHEAIYGLCYIL